MERGMIQSFKKQIKKARFKSSSILTEVGSGENIEKVRMEKLKILFC